MALSDAALEQLSLGPDLLDDVSNGLLTNEFVDTFTYPGAIAIPDNYPPGFEASIDVGDVGIAKEIRVHVALINSDISSLTLRLTDPTGAEHVLYDGGGAGDALDATWPNPDAVVSGDLQGWVGQNPAGTWTLHIADGGFLNNLQDGEVSAFSIDIDTLSSKKVKASADLEVTGSVQVGQSDAPCDASRAGAVTFDVDSKALHVCDGQTWLRLKTCDPSCPSASTVVCGQAVTSACDDACGTLGSATDAVACLGQVSTTPCGTAVVDSCNNDCGLTGTAPSGDACPGAAEVACGSVISDACGNVCSGLGQACSAGSCLDGACCGDSVQSGSEACDDGNQIDGDGCSSTCQGEGVNFLGFITWQQQCSAQSDAEQDQIMNSTCSGQYGGTARAATIAEIASGAILGLPGNNSSGNWLMGVCPDCQGNPSNCVSGFCRKCVDPGNPWPTSIDVNAGWHDNCCGSSRSAICVN